MTTPPKVTKTPGYIQTKIRFCQTDPFRALGRNGYVVQLLPAIRNREVAKPIPERARLREDATDKVAFPPSILRVTIYVGF